MKLKVALIISLAAANALLAKDSVELKDITVTSQKQEERYIDVPISLNVFNEFDIEDKKIDNISDLGNTTSNLIFLNAGGSSFYSPFIRGMASDTGVESSNVAIYIDGIPYVNTFENDIFMDGIQRIEVLKGPQSILYGKNSYAGVINIISKEPSNEFGGSIGVELGSDNKRKYTINVNTPIIQNKLFLDFFYRHYEKDGFINNENLDTDDNFRQNDFAKVNLKYLVNENLDISLISSLLKKEDGGLSWNATTSRTVTNDLQGKNHTDNFSNALKINYDLDGFNFTSVTTAKDLTNVQNNDSDFSTTNSFHVIGDMDVEEYSQEFRFLKQNDSFKYLFGVYADSMTKDRHNKLSTTTFQKYKTDSKTTSVFANGDYMISEKLSFSFGGRLDRDKIDLDDSFGSYQDSNSYTVFSPKVTLKYSMDKNTMVYSTISKGYKAGGYYLFTPSNDTRWVDKETMINYEVGTKAYMDDLTLGFSAFYMDITNKQISTHVSSSTSYVQNAAKAQSRGFEFDVDYKVTDDINLYAAFGYSDSTLKDFVDSEGSYSGNDNPYSPKYTYSIGTKYRDDAGIFANINLKGQDEMFSDKENTLTTDSYYTIDAKIGYEQELYDIYLYGTNILDEEYDTLSGANLYFLSPPREIGVQFKLRF